MVGCGMNLVDVVQELGDQLDTIDGLNVFRYIPDSLSPPAGIISIYDNINFDETYRRGEDRITIPVIIVVSRAQDRAAFTNLLPYGSGSGPQSIKSTMEAGIYTSFDSMRVMRSESDVFRFGGTDYFGALFDVDIIGAGE